MQTVHDCCPTVDGGLNFLLYLGKHGLARGDMPCGPDTTCFTLQSPGHAQVSSQKCRKYAGKIHAIYTAHRNMYGSSLQLNLHAHLNKECYCCHPSHLAKDLGYLIQLRHGKQHRVQTHQHTGTGRTLS